MKQSKKQRVHILYVILFFTAINIFSCVKKCEINSGQILLVKNLNEKHIIEFDINDSKIQYITPDKKTILLKKEYIDELKVNSCLLFEKSRNREYRFQTFTDGIFMRIIKKKNTCDTIFLYNVHEGDLEEFNEGALNLYKIAHEIIYPANRSL